MRVAALIVGAFGGIAGFTGGIIVLVLSGVGGIFALEGAGGMAVQSLVALAMSVLGLVGAALSIAKPRLAALFMVIAAVFGVIAISVGYSMAAIPKRIAAMRAFLGRERQAPAPPASHPQVP